MSDIFDLDLFPCMTGFTPDFAQTTQIFLSVRDEPSPISSPGPWFPFQPHVEFRKLASGTFCSDSIYASAPKQSTNGFPVLSIPSCHLDVLENPGYITPPCVSTPRGSTGKKGFIICNMYMLHALCARREWLWSSLCYGWCGVYCISHTYLMEQDEETGRMLFSFLAGTLVSSFFSVFCCLFSFSFLVRCLDPVLEPACERFGCLVLSCLVLLLRRVDIAISVRSMIDRQYRIDKCSSMYIYLAK